MIRKSRNPLLLLLGLALASTGMALDSDRQKPLKIVADTAVIDEQDGTATYTGNVVLTQGTLRIAADSLQITTQQNKVDVVMAAGDPALFSQVPEPGQAEVIAKALNIDYMVREQKLLLKREASIVQGENIFRGEEIMYEIQSQRLQASGQAADPRPGDIKGRVEMILPAAGEIEPELPANRAPDTPSQPPASTGGEPDS